MGVGFGFTKETTDTRYECRGCGAVFTRQYHVCPDCEGFSVDPVEDVQGSH